MEVIFFSILVYSYSHCGCWCLYLGFPGRVSVGCTVVQTFFSIFVRREHQCAPDALRMHYFAWNFLCDEYIFSLSHLFIHWNAQDTKTEDFKTLHRNSKRFSLHIFTPQGRTASRLHYPSEHGGRDAHRKRTGWPTANEAHTQLTPSAPSPRGGWLRGVKYSGIPIWLVKLARGEGATLSTLGDSMFWSDCRLLGSAQPDVTYILHNGCIWRSPNLRGWYKVSG